MEGQPLDSEETQETGYRTYQAENFDLSAREAAPATAGPGTPALESPVPGSAGPAATGGEFEPLIEAEREERSTFEDRPQSVEEADLDTDFSSIKFQRENSLLTNAESYAASIREEAQLYVKQLRGEVEALNAEAEKRYREADQVKADAVAEAEGLIAEANATVEEVREQGRQEGFEAGRKEGLEQRYAEAGIPLERLESILSEIAQFRRRVAFYTEKDGIRLALLIAKKILHTELKINKSAVLKLLAATLAKLDGKGTFRVWLSAEDHEFMTAARPSLEKFLDEDQALTLRARPGIQPGNVLIETDREVIDLTFESQFFHLERMLNQTLGEREAVLTQRSARARNAQATSGTPRPPGPANAKSTPTADPAADPAAVPPLAESPLTESPIAESGPSNQDDEG